MVDIAHIGDPKALGAFFICKLHLLPGLDELNCIDTLVISWYPDMIKMVINTSTTWAVSLVGEGRSHDVSTVVIRPNQ